MYTQNIFQEVKDAIVEKTRDLSIKDFDSYQEWLKPHHSIIKKLAQIQELNELTEAIKVGSEAYNDIQDSKESDSEQASDSTEQQEVVEEQLKEQNVDMEPLPVYATVPVTKPIEVHKAKIDQVKTPENKHVWPIGFRFTFHQKAYGGALPALDYYMAEEYTRNMSLENGYVLEVLRQTSTFRDGNPIYDFKIIDRTVVDNPDMFHVSSGIVEKTTGRLVVMKTVNGPIRINENPVVLYISDKDRDKSGIEEGDIIDGRFYVNAVTHSFRVTYKHDFIYQPSEPSVEEKRLSHRQANPAETEAGRKMIEELDLEPFKGKKILLVGLSNRMSDFADMLRGVEEVNFSHLSGDEHKTRIRSFLTKADIVLLSTQSNSHSATKYCAGICNQFNIPFSNTHADGISGILRDAKELIEFQAA